MEEITKLDDIETEKQKFHPHKETFSINNIHTNKIAIYPIRSLLVKKDLNTSLATKMLKKFDLCVYFSQK